MERFLVFFGAIMGAWFLIRAIPQLHLGKAPSAQTDNHGRPVLSPAELRFFQVLRQAVPSGYEVWPKANLADYTSQAHQYVDFLLTYGFDRRPVLIVELEEMTTQGFRRVNGDTALAGCLPVLYINSDGDYLAPILQAQIERSLGLEQRKAA